MSDRTTSEGALQWRKAGTIERIMRADGLHVIAKAICTLLIGPARTSDADPRAMMSETDVARILGLTAKTVRKHIDVLERRGLIEKRRDRRHGRMSFYITGLVREFGYQIGKNYPSGIDDPLSQIGKNYPSETDLGEPDGKNLPSRAVKFSIQSGKFYRSQHYSSINSSNSAAAAEENIKTIADLLVDEGYFAPEDAQRWARELTDLEPHQVLAAARTMRTKPAYRRQEIRSHAAYLRRLVNDGATLHANHLDAD